MKTRIRSLKDGSLEIIRLLSLEELAASSKDDPLFYEKSIIWLQDPATLPFVHVKKLRSARSRRGPIYLGGGARVVGYTKLTPNARRNSLTDGYARRVFYIHGEGDHARHYRAAEKRFDPMTIFPGESGSAIPGGHSMTS